MTEPNQINPPYVGRINSARRQLLIRGAKAAASIAAAVGVARWLYDPKGPGAKNEEIGFLGTSAKGLPDFSVPRKDGQVISIIKGQDRAKTVSKAIELLGGIEIEIGKPIIQLLDRLDRPFAQWPDEFIHLCQ